MRILRTDVGQECAEAHASDDFIRTNSHTPPAQNFRVTSRWLAVRSGRLLELVVARFWRADPDASRLDGHDRTLRKQGAVRVDRCDSSHALVSGADVYQSQDASMGNASDVASSPKSLSRVTTDC